LPTENGSRRDITVPEVPLSFAIALFKKTYQICVRFSGLEGRWRHPFVDELPQLLDGHAVDVLLTQLGLNLLTPCCCRMPLGCDYSLFFVP
jgi:hypothetical protein